MTPQEQELIQNVADKLKASPNSTKDADAERLIKQEIASQDDIVYKLTQAVLIQEMALKDLKSQSDFLEQQVAHYKSESERSAFSRMIGGSNPAPVPPTPVEQPSAFGSFMKTAAGVAVGVVAGSLIANALLGDDETAPAPEAASAAAPADATPAAETQSTPEAPAEVAQAAAAPVEQAAQAAAEPVEQAAQAAAAPVEQAAQAATASVEQATPSFLGDNAGFASEFSAPDTNSLTSTLANADFADEEDFEEEI